MSSACINDLIDEVVSTLPPVRRRAYQRLLARPKIRAEVVDHIAVEIADDPCCEALLPQLNAVGFDGQTMLAIDPDVKKKLLELFLTYLPLILKLFFGV